MTTFRSFSIGMNEINGYTVTVERVISAQQAASNVRIAARYFGTITTPEGEIIELGISGKTSPQIKRIIGLTTSSGDKQLNSMKKALKALESAGLDTTEVAEKIAAREAELQAIADEQAELNQARKDAVKVIRKQIKKLENAKKAMELASLDCEDIANKIAELKNQI